MLRLILFQAEKALYSELLLAIVFTGLEHKNFTNGAIVRYSISTLKRCQT
jgi:hypothetical protein